MEKPQASYLIESTRIKFLKGFLSSSMGVTTAQNAPSINDNANKTPKTFSLANCVHNVFYGKKFS